jgi:UDP-2,3-diacylglucosamine hydrolase
MVYFFSDVHLGLGSRQSSRRREQELLRFLDAIKSDCERLVIVGDLFDYWFEYSTVIPKYYFRILTTLSSFREQGITIDYLMGNHDFGHQDFFEKELDIPIHHNDISLTLGEKKFYIAHGDGKAYNDTGYLILRAILRNKLSIKLFQWLHPDIGIWLASGSSHASRAYTDDKEYGKRDGLQDFAEKKINEGYDFVIMGHRHRAAKINFNSGTYINLGHWLAQPATFARFDGKTVELLTTADLGLC